MSGPQSSRFQDDGFVLVRRSAIEAKLQDQEGSAATLQKPSPVGGMESKSLAVDLPMTPARMMRSKRGAAPDLPTKLQTTVEARHVFRFQCQTAPSAQAISVNNILGACGGVCSVVNSKVTSFASSIRVNSVTVWLSPSSTVAVSADVAWVGSSTYSPDEKYDESLPTTVSNTKSAVFRPPSQSLASFWQSSSGSTTLFTITASAGSIVDLDVSIRLSNSLLPVQTTVAVATIQTVYYLALDGPSTNIIRPLGLPTTA